MPPVIDRPSFLSPHSNFRPRIVSKTRTPPLHPSMEDRDIHIHARARAKLRVEIVLPQRGIRWKGKDDWLSATDLLPPNGGRKQRCSILDTSVTVSSRGKWTRNGSEGREKEGREEGKLLQFHAVPRGVEEIGLKRKKSNSREIRLPGDAIPRADLWID